MPDSRGASRFLGEAKAYATKAREAEEVDKDFKRARDLYLRAAQAFLEASKASSDPQEKKLREDLAETFLAKSQSMGPQPKSSGGSSQGGSSSGGKQGSSEDEGKEVIPIERPTTNFNDVGGLDGVKEDIRKAIVYPFQHPELYEMYGKKAGEGILLYGPPGCGKTFIVRAAAGEIGIAFLTMAVSDVMSKWLGESEQNVRAAFDAASRNAPSILFFDEIDAVGGRRDEDQQSAGKRIVNEMLVQMDGVQGPRDKVLIMAGTNAPWDVDPALRRPGRFSKLILVPPPDQESRKQIFKIQTKKKPIDPTVDFEDLAKRTDGYSSADISQICNEAADIPLSEAIAGKPPRKILQQDFYEVLKKRTSSITPWFRLAKASIEKSGEKDIFQELFAYIEKYA